MNAIRNNHFKWIVVAGLVLISCSKKSLDSGFGKIERKRTSELVQHLEELSKAEWDFLSTKIAIRFSSREQKQSFKTTLKMKKDSAINATITFAAIPIINSVLTYDSLKVVNKKDKCFILADLDILKDKFEIPFDFPQVEELLLGLPLAWETDEKYHQLDDLKHYVISSHKKRFINRRESRPENNILIRYFLHPQTLDLERIALDSPQDTLSIRIQFYDRYTDMGIPLPQRTELEIFTPRDTIAVEMKFQKPETEKEKVIFLTIPDSYEECN